VAAAVPESDPYHNAVVRWLEGFNCESNIAPAQLFEKTSGNIIRNLSLKEMYWLDIYPYETNRIAVSMGAPSPQPLALEQVNTSLAHPAYTNVRMTAYMMITNVQTGGRLFGRRAYTGAHAPYTVQGLSGESSAEGYSDASPNWTSATYRVTGNLMRNEGIWRSLRYFVFDDNSFGKPGEPDAFTAEIDIWDPFSALSPIYTQSDVRWWPLRGVENPVIKAKMDDAEKPPVRVRTLRRQNRLPVE
jgi:hypothetical protein